MATKNFDATASRSRLSRDVEPACAEAATVRRGETAPGRRVETAPSATATDARRSARVSSKLAKGPVKPQCSTETGVSRRLEDDGDNEDDNDWDEEASPEEVRRRPAYGNHGDKEEKPISEDDEEFREALEGLADIARYPSLATTLAHCTATVVSCLATYKNFKAHEELIQLVNKGDAVMVDRQKDRLYHAGRYGGAASALSAVASLVGGIVEASKIQRLDKRVTELIADRK